MEKHRHNKDEPIRLAVFRTRDLTNFHVTCHKEVIPMGYVNSEEEFDGYVALEYPNATRVESVSHRGSGKYYYTDGSYNVFYVYMDKLNVK